MSLQFQTECPACRSASRTDVHVKVPDFVFRATTETWNIVRCDACGSLYLPERPGPSSIGAYYQRYYTHADEESSRPISGIAVDSSVLRRLANSWRNARYGTHRRSLGPLGTALMAVAWPLRLWIDAECRHLPPALRATPGYRVLDVGFGDGRFLRLAAEAGCEAVGFEVDDKAVASARALGMNVHAGDIDKALETYGREYFDYITMSHVIEHVHEPQRVLRAACDLLRRGGKLWIETPNPQSYGHELFGARWRDLDPPRHLCLMTKPALVDAARKVGLTLEAEHHRPFVAFEVFPFSNAALDKPASRLATRLRCAWFELKSWLHPDRREWLTCSFRRI